LSDNSATFPVAGSHATHDNTTRQSKEARIPYQRRLIKTGAAALIATAIFAVIVFLAAEWNKSPMRDVAAATRSDAANAASPPSNPAASVTKIIPQVVIGSFDSGLTKYSTVVEVVNTGNTQAVITGAFYKEDGNLSPVTLTTNVEGHTTFAGRLDSLTLPAGGALIISAGSTTATTPPSGVLGWGKLTATGTISVSTFFEVRDGATNALYSRIGVPASRPDLSSFLIPRVHTRNGLDVAFAIVNTGAKPASIMATLKDANGATLAKRMMSMNGGTHQALFAHQFFSLPAESNDLDYQYIVFNSDSPSFAAIALAFENGTQTSFPVDPLQ
jgi:hypothetical protein